MLASVLSLGPVSALPRLSAGAVRTSRGPWTWRAPGTTTPSPMTSWTTCTRGPARAVSTSPSFSLRACRAGHSSLPPVPPARLISGHRTPCRLTEAVVSGRGGQSGGPHGPQAHGGPVILGRAPGPYGLHAQVPELPMVLLRVLASRWEHRHPSGTRFSVLFQHLGELSRASSPHPPWEGPAE